MNRSGSMSERMADRLVIGISVMYAFFAASLSLLRFYQFKVFVGDLGVYSQALWNLVNGNGLQVTLLSYLYGSGGPVNLFTLHLSPILYLVAPIFQIVPLPAGLIALKCVLIAAGAPVLYMISKKYIPPVLSLGIALIYLSSPNAMSAIHDSFHLDYFAPLVVFGVFYFFVQEKLIPYALAIVFLVLIKESYVITPLAFALLGLWRRRGARWVWVPIVIALVYGLAAHLMTDHFYRLAPPIDNVNYRKIFFDHLSPSALIASLSGHSGNFTAFVLSDLRFLTFVTGAFIIWIPQFLINLAVGTGFGDHYGTFLSAMMLATVPLALAKIRGWLSRGGVDRPDRILGTLILVGLITSFPSLSILSPRHFTANVHIAAQREVLSLIPAQASVTAPELYLAHLSSRPSLDNLAHVSHIDKNDYVLIDMDPKNNIRDEWKILQALWRPHLEASPAYQLIYDRSGIRLYKKIDNIAK